MNKVFNISCALALAIPMISSASETKLIRSTSIDPGGCALEHIAVELGINQFQYDSLSPDGRSIAIGWDRGKNERGTYILDLVTGERAEISALDNGAVFAPDGKTLINSIYSEDGKTDIVEYDLLSKKVSAIASHPEWDWLASYSSDGGTVLFNSYRTGSSDIYTYNVKSEKIKQWTNDDAYEAHAQFSPDDSKILFHRKVGESDFNIFVIDRKTEEISRLTTDTSEESYASWSPDGKFIVFASDRHQKAGVTDIYIMNSDGNKVRRLTNIGAKDAYPFFSPDGQYLYFNSYREPQGVYRMTLDKEFNCLKAQ